MAPSRLFTAYELKNGSLSYCSAHFSFLLMSVFERYNCEVNGLNCSLGEEESIQNERNISTWSAVVLVLSRLKAYIAE